MYTNKIKNVLRQYIRCMKYIWEEGYWVNILFWLMFYGGIIYAINLVIQYFNIL